MRLLRALFCFALAGANLLAQSSAAKPRVRVVTSYGPILLELEPEAAPRTVENFLAYVKAGFYSGTIFHRVIPGFMIQGGGMTESLQEKPTRAPIPNEAGLAAKAGLHNKVGTIAMARTNDPDSATAQFYINVVDNPPLDYQDSSRPGYCPFGRVVEGMDVVTKIEKVITVMRKGLANVPEYPVRIKSAEVVAP